MSPSAAIATSRTAAPQAFAYGANRNTGIRLSVVAQAVIMPSWLTASRPRTNRKPRICTVFHGHDSVGSAFITPRNNIGYASRQARTGRRTATATGSTEPIARIVITMSGISRLSAR
jgi:hypothetical protein